MHGHQITGWLLRVRHCSACSNYIFNLAPNSEVEGRLVEPKSVLRSPVSGEVPVHLAEDYREACLVLADSPKASAALARRCLQGILHDRGIKERDLSKEIDALLAASDPSLVIPESLRTTIDAIRNFGNFSAHPVTDKTTLQVIAVEPHEAEWCLDLIEELFEHFYVKPAEARRRKKLLDEKLLASGKPASK